MSDYTPTTGEVRGRHNANAILDSRTWRMADAEFDRWLAAHDAEVRASVVTEEPEWEYGTALRTPQGALWDFEFEGTREAAEWHVRACEKDGHEHGMDNCVIVRRAPRISAGEWEVEPS